MNFRIFVFLILGGLIFGASQAFSAEDVKKDYRVLWDQKIQEIHDQLGLNADQQKALEENRKKYQEQKESIYQEIREIRRELNEELQKTDFDMNAMHQLHGRIKELKLKKEDLRFDSILEVKRILSAEQFEQFMKLKEDMKLQFKKQK